MLYKKHALVKIGKICNNNCMSCSISAVENTFIIPTQKVKEELLKIKDAGFTSVELIGGEVTIQKNYLELLKFTRSLFQEVVLVTNGRLLSYDDYAKKLIETCPGLNIEIAVHGHNAETHDAHTRTPHSFDQVMGGIRNVIKYKRYFGTLGINTLITKLNYKTIDKILNLILKLGSVDEWYLLSLAPTDGTAQKNLSKLMVPHKELLYLNSVLDKAYKNLKCIDMNEFPVCLFNEDIREKKKDKIHIINSDVIELDENGIVCNYNPTFSFNDADYISNISIEGNLDKIRKIHDSFRKRVRPCKNCQYHSRCGGLWTRYVDFYGESTVEKEIELLNKKNNLRLVGQKKKVLLISIDSVRSVLPLGLLKLKANARNSDLINEKYEIIIETFYDNDSTPDDVVNFITDMNPAAVGFSVAVWNEKKIAEIVAILKKKNSIPVIFVGGPQIVPDYLLRNKNIDFAFIGEAEDSFLHFLEAGFDREKLKTIQGIAFVGSDGKLIFTLRKRKLDLSDLPSIVSSDVIDFSRYASYQQIETTRGCPYKCAYCEEPNRFDRVSFFPLDKVKKEFEFILDRSNYLEITDNNFNLDYERTEKICRYLTKLQKKYNKKKKIFAALNYLLVDEKQVCWLKRAGITKIEFGLQTINPTAYKLLDRFPPKLDKFKKIMDLFDSEFEIIVDMIYGLPGDDLKSFLRTAYFIMSCKTEAKVVINCERLKILPRSTFAAADFKRKYKIKNALAAPYSEISNFTFSAKDMEKAEEFAKTVIAEFNSGKK